jgi:hypothetical protein
MDPMNKPEWFQLAESDGGLPRRNSKRGIRAIVLSIPLMAIGIGVVVAQTSNESPASAETTSVPAPLASSSPIAPTLVASSPASTKAVQTIQPAIAKPPTGGGDDDDDEYEDDDEGDDD